MERLVQIEVEGGVLEGNLALPAEPTGLVLFAHGSGSSRHSPRNRFVARVLQEAGLGTLLVDLLTPQDEAADARTAQIRFDIGHLARRLGAVSAWVARADELRTLRVGYFGASTGAAAALVAAAEAPERVSAVVSRGGRPDLADTFLTRVAAPTLLIVGSRDVPVIGMNEAALAQLRCAKEMVIVPGASHLFEEPGTLEEVARLAREWFLRRMKSEG